MFFKYLLVFLVVFLEYLFSDLATWVLRYTYFKEHLSVDAPKYKKNDMENNTLIQQWYYNNNTIIINNTYSPSLNYPQGFDGKGTVYGLNVI